MNNPKIPDSEDLPFRVPHLNEPAPQKVQKDYCDIKIPDPIPMTRHHITVRYETSDCADCGFAFRQELTMIAGRAVFKHRTCPDCDWKRVKDGRAR